ncbi:hypothetical protein UCRPC4_g01431 [Phaeomoniella chlamydospora]|uniref:Coiled-coil domain-containing protein 174 n=1 Tax=Phaeomoniella chlamydospora TaxID=158046 RepID=A0A0G2HE15_PHACM|nr:hypothetical protein UCRPC4_g01431 [Phaeomoniella chlamydospora]
MADAHLYGIRQPKNKHKEISSSTSLAFSSHLASLISKESSKPSETRPSSAQPKSNIFTAHKKAGTKRGFADIDDSNNVTQKHKTEEELGGSLDAADHQRSRRKMEEKARLYAAMKRGDYVTPDGGRGRDEQLSALVDFDRKWAEREARREATNDFDTSSDSEDNVSDVNNEEELFDYSDEFGRARKLSRHQIARLEREKRIAANFASDADAMSARPTMPSNIIYGDAVQHQAFNPDDDVAIKMAELAAKRDREATPPEDTHYDASKEIRTKGTGFYSFSGDKEGREREMQALEQERLETERRRKLREKEKEERRRMLEERKKKVREARGKKHADKFLEGLEVDIGVEPGLGQMSEAEDGER